MPQIGAKGTGNGFSLTQSEWKTWHLLAFALIFDVRNSGQGSSRQPASSGGRLPFAVITSQALPGEVECAVQEVVRHLIGGKGLRRVTANLAGKSTHSFGFIAGGGEQLADEIGPAVENLAEGIDVAFRIVVEREVCEEESLRVKPGNRIERGVPEFKGNIGGRRGRKHESMPFDRNAGSVAHKGDALCRVEVRHVMRSVSGSVMHLKLPRAKRKDFAAIKNVQ